MKKTLSLVTLLLASAITNSTTVNASVINAADLDVLNIGAKIVGPVGPDVEVSLVNADGNSVGDLRSSVSCPASFVTCTPPNNPIDTIYTYTHTVIPGVDNPNDPPFPNPPITVPFDNVTGFSLGFEAVGFNGVAGYSFNEANAANVMFDISLSTSGELVWTTDSLDWDTGEAITFFWQTTQAPSGPGGTFNVDNANGAASGRGPIPTALPVPVPEPTTLALLLAGILGLGIVRKR